MTLDELLRDVDATLASLGRALDTAGKVEGHRAALVRSQLEVAREVILKARGYGAGKGSGTYNATELPKPDPGRGR